MRYFIYNNKNQLILEDRCNDIINKINGIILGLYEKEYYNLEFIGIYYNDKLYIYKIDNLNKPLYVHKCYYKKTYPLFYCLYKPKYQQITNKFAYYNDNKYHVISYPDFKEIYTSENKDEIEDLLYSDKLILGKSIDSNRYEIKKIFDNGNIESHILNINGKNMKSTNTKFISILHKKIDKCYLINTESMEIIKESPYYFKFLETLNNSDYFIEKYLDNYYIYNIKNPYEKIKKFNNSKIEIKTLKYKNEHFYIVCIYKKDYITIYDHKLNYIIRLPKNSNFSIISNNIIRIKNDFNEYEYIKVEPSGFQAYIDVPKDTKYLESIGDSLYLITKNNKDYILLNFNSSISKEFKNIKRILNIRKNILYLNDKNKWYIYNIENNEEFHIQNFGYDLNNLYVRKAYELITINIHTNNINKKIMFNF